MNEIHLIDLQNIDTRGLGRLLKEIQLELAMRAEKERTKDLYTLYEAVSMPIAEWAELKERLRSRGEAMPSLHLVSSPPIPRS